MKKLIKAKNTEFEQNARTLAIIDTRQRGGKPIMIDADVLDEAIANGELDALESIHSDKTVIPTKDITANGTYKAKDEGADGYGELNVNVDVQPNLGTKTINENGTYNASDDGLDGYSSVEVETSGDLTEYFNESIDGASSNVAGFVLTIKKLPAYTFNGTKASYMFHWFPGETLNLSKFDTSNVTTFENMFENCRSLKQLDLSNFNTSKATSFGSMFAECWELEELDISNFNTANVTSFYSMFANCKKLTKLDLSHFNTTKANNMGFMFMFSGCENLEELDISSFTSQITANLSGMFASCKKLVSLDLSGLDFGKVIQTSNFLNGCSALTNLSFATNFGKGFTAKTANNSSYQLSLSSSKNLTHDSLMDVINKLYDLNLTYDVANGGTLYTQKLILGSTNLAKLTEEEVAIATNKGWTVS